MHPCVGDLEGGRPEAGMPPATLAAQGHRTLRQGCFSATAIRLSRSGRVPGVLRLAHRAEEEQKKTRRKWFSSEGGCEEHQQERTAQHKTMHLQAATSDALSTDRRHMFNGHQSVSILVL